MQNADFKQSFEALCAFMLKQATLDKDLVIELHPFAEERSGVKEGSISTHASLQISTLFESLGNAIRSIPRASRITPALRMHVYSDSFNEVAFMIGRDFLWDRPFKEGNEMFVSLNAGLKEIAKTYPDGPVSPFIVRGDGTGIFADGREYTVDAATKDEAHALFGLMQSSRMDGRTNQGVVEIIPKHSAAQ